MDAITARLLRAGEECGAIYDYTHVVLVSGLHSDGYFNGAKLLCYPRLAQLFSNRLAVLLVRFGVQTIAGPLAGGAIWAHDTARWYEWPPNRVVNSVYAKETESKGRTFDRDQAQFIKDKPVAVVDDVLTTGLTVYATIDAIEQAGGEVRVVAVICDRFQGEWKYPSIEVVSLLKRNWRNWGEAICPMCQEGKPIETRIGHGVQFLRSHPERATEEQKILLGLT